VEGRGALRACFSAQQATWFNHERGKERTGSSQRLPQPACDARVQRSPERRLERMLEPPVARRTFPARLSCALKRQIFCRRARLQTVCNVKTCVEPCGERKEYLMSCTAHACRTCTHWPALLAEERALWSWSGNKGQLSASAGYLCSSSSRRTALRRAASLAVDERVLMLRCGVCCWRASGSAGACCAKA